MLRSFFAGVLVAAPITAVPLMVGTDSNPIAHEPVVLYEVTGGTFLGPYDLGLTVYADGQARLSSAVMFGEQPRVKVINVGAEAATGLAQDLLHAGAFEQQDQMATVTDVPLNTLTVFAGATESRAHTYSWWIPAGKNQAAPAVLHAFINAHFKGF